MKSVCGGSNEQSNCDYLRSGYLHHRLPVMGCNHYRDNAMTYKEQRDKATSIIADMQKRQRDVAELDARYTKELADANATIESLRDDVSAGRERLQVAATCAKSTTGASGMGDGESPGLTADAELNYYRLRSGIDRITAQVNYLQEYIRTQCLK